ncbi:MAG: hypothetical protein ABFS45_12695, partial [Pseudomonadota bacterium]
TKVLYWCLHHPFELNRYFAVSPPETNLFTSSELAKGYHRDYITRIILDEGYHDWQDSAIVYGAQDSGLERAEFSAFEKSPDLPWEIGVVD